MVYINRILEYLSVGTDYLKQCFGYAVAAYGFILILLVVTGKRAFRSIAIYKYLTEFLLVWWSCLILEVTGILESGYFEVPSKEEVLGSLFQIPFLGNAFSMIVLNLLLFVPFGFFLPVVVSRWRNSWKNTFFMGLCFSLLIETAQLFTGRMFELDDILANAFGALLGFQIFDICSAYYNKERKHSGLKKLAGTFFVYGAAICLVFVLADGERVQLQEEKDYPGIDGDTEAYGDLAEIRLISPKGIVSGDRDELEDIDTIFAWMATRIDSSMSVYQQGEVKGLPPLDDRGTIVSDYIELYYAHPHSFRFVNKKDFQMEAVQYLLYDAGNGDIWYGKTRENLTGFLSYEDAQHPFEIDEELVSLIEEGNIGIR